MKVIKTKINKLPKMLNESIISIGMFDSFHIYHKLILHELEKIGLRKNLKKIILTFDRKPNQNQQAIITEEKKIKYLKTHFNIDYLIIVEANSKLVSTSRKKFVKILKNKLKVKELVEGADFRFGKNQKGNVEYLINKFDRSNITIFERNNDVSSSKIRKMLKENDLENLSQIIDLELIENA